MLDAPAVLPHGHEETPQLGLGQPGKDGLLDLTLARDDRTGQTVLRTYRHQSPLQMGRVLYPDAARPDVAHCYVAMVTGGLVQGDRLRQRIAVEPGARAHITTLSATKVYGMARNVAVQRVELSVGAGAVLEWWPHPVIPFARARFRQDVELLVHPGGVLLYGDLLLPGRAGRGERHEYSYYHSRVVARRPGGALLGVDTLAAAPPPPGGRALRETLPEGLEVLGTVLVLCPEPAVPVLLAALRAVAHGWPGASALGGCSALPGGGGVVLRLLAADGPSGRRVMGGLLECVRHTLAQVVPATRRPTTATIGR